MKRRDFIKIIGGTLIFPSLELTKLNAQGLTFSYELSSHEARYYKKLPERRVQCLLCPRECIVGDKERGYCGVRENRGGKYVTLVYGRPVTVALDPIEKKPLFHFLPGKQAFSIATAGCNVNCKFCQNWQISQVRPEQVRSLNLPPEATARLAYRYHAPIIAYTYTEPIVFAEYMLDTAREASRRGIRNVIVTGAHVLPEPWKDIVSAMDGIKIDLKAFTEEFYQRIVRGHLKPVLDAIVAAAKSGKWLEIVYLVIPTLNDNLDNIRKMSRWLVREVGRDVPVHFSRFFPMYMLKNLPATPVKTLESAREVAMSEGLKFVYVGNIPGHPGESTYCPRCGKTIIKRVGYEIKEIHIKNGKCEYCGEPIPGVWS
ncbi:MAG: AmmeMemoRadiSam system radical SAM enzyme [Candidatus Aminicenantes bacterium]|nr:AmmeMemoRadiSam system radical SAM enzyme [Candidatus Aminicenantes bacterium]